MRDPYLCNRLKYPTVTYEIRNVWDQLMEQGLCMLISRWAFCQNSGPLLSLQNEGTHDDRRGPACKTRGPCTSTERVDCEDFLFNAPILFSNLNQTAVCPVFPGSCDWVEPICREAYAINSVIDRWWELGLCVLLSWARWSG